MGDRYAYKLKLLSNNIDLAKEGKFTYDTLGEASEQALERVDGGRGILEDGASSVQVMSEHGDEYIQSDVVLL